MSLIAQTTPHVSQLWLKIAIDHDFFFKAQNCPYILLQKNLNCPLFKTLSTLNYYNIKNKY